MTVDTGDVPAVVEVMQSFVSQTGIREVGHDDEIAKITVSGIGLRSHTQVGTVLFDQLAAAGLNVEMISTSELQVNAVVDPAGADGAVERLRRAFDRELV